MSAPDFNALESGHRKYFLYDGRHSSDIAVIRQLGELPAIASSHRWTSTRWTSRTPAIM